MTTAQPRRPNPPNASLSIPVSLVPRQLAAECVGLPACETDTQFPNPVEPPNLRASRADSRFLFLGNQKTSSYRIRSLSPRKFTLIPPHKTLPSCSGQESTTLGRQLPGNDSGRFDEQTDS
ncbi:hypothetical protein DBV15_07573 [Temnothorax longispinosus]|uniref:Uncharacterized protein n=1 Tax=Temnothorax longispinosus TaxID=300112 RepID=A0A4S2LC15_9HYME|nr:hypothetical protein DBV15_07573 [Temnothorax longispinosus]